MIPSSLPYALRLERYRDVVPDWPSFLEILDVPLPQCAWTNRLRTSPDQVREWISPDAEPLDWLPGAFKVKATDGAGRTPAFLAGLIHLQEEASLLPVVLLDPRPGERILDLCSAPGNKTAQIAVAMQNTGTIVANDRSAMRTRATRGTLDRLGIVNTTITLEDAANFPPEAGTFDRVLADVPCTCEGTTRKHATALIDSGRRASMRMHGLQQAILRKAVQLCRAGGRIVYATCTYAPEENEMVVDAVLRENEGRIRLLPARIPGVVSAPGLTSWQGDEFDASLARAMRVWPHQNDSGGFFVAVIEKREDGRANGRSAVVGDGGDTRRDEPVAVHGDSSESGSGNDLCTEGPVGPEWRAMLEDRFGIPGAILERYRLLRSSKKYVGITNADHETVDRPVPVSIGMPLIRTQLRHPKLTTAGAQLLGSHAVRNTVEATSEQTAAYLARDSFRLLEEQLQTLADVGYVIVRFRGIPLGVGLYKRRDGVVDSMFPIALSRADVTLVTS